jgi:hypothetical protein
MLTHQQDYRDLGDRYLDQLRRTDLERALVRRLEKLGHKVTLEPAA